MTKSIFITATGTDVGKTYISALIVKKMREHNYNCGYFKPVLSGAYMNDFGALIAGDCEYVIEKAKLQKTPFKYLSYSFSEAVSPHLASKRSNTEINTDKILNDFSTLKQEYDYILVEGAGGITCPLNISENKTLLLSDLIKEMNADIIIVADGGLGTINSVLTTVEYAQNHNIKIAGIILNNYDENHFMHTDNKEVIEQLTNIPVIATVGKNQNDININIEYLKTLFKEV